MDALSALLGLPEGQQRELGVEHTAAEIAQQPKTWLATLALCERQRAALQQFLGKQSGLPVLLVGAGTSDFVGRSIERLLERQWRTPVRAVASTDLLTDMDAWLRADTSALCISISRSGDSSEGVAAIEEMRRRFPQVTHLIIT